MKRKNLLTAAMLLALGSGCVVDEVQLSPKPQPISPAPAPVRMIPQANANFSVVSEVSTKLRVQFRWNAAEQNFCSKLAKRLAGTIIPDKATMVLDSPGDVVVTLVPEFELIDKAREYYRVKCNQISVSIASRQRVYAMKTITPRSLPRKLGVHNAKNQYLAVAVKNIAPFLKRELEKISRENVAVSVLDFALANVQEHPEPQYIAKQVNRISQILRSTSGVLNFINIRQNVSQATCSFRVVYLKEQFPQGISNVLNLKLAGK